MNLTEAIYSRRSVRGYTSRPVDEATIGVLLRAAVQAPSAMNAQPWIFAVVQNTDQLKRYSDRAKTMLLEQLPKEAKTRQYAERLANPEFNIFYDASTLIVIGARHGGAYIDADCWLAAQNLLLEATAQFLGSCCIGLALPALNTLETKAELGFPPGGVAVAPIIIGYPKASPPPVPRADVQLVSWSRPSR